MKSRFLIIPGIVVLILGVDGFWFMSSDIHDHCIFNMELGHNVYADSYPPCEIAKHAITISGILFVASLVFLIAGSLLYRRPEINHFPQ